MEFAAVALPLALGVIMFGLGLDLTPADFVRVANQPNAAAVASARASASRALRNCSGAMKCGVPKPLPVRVRFRSPPKSLTKPMSVSRAIPSKFTKILSGLTSR